MQEEHEKLLRRIEVRMQDVEMNLKNVRVMLQEKVDQLNEQVSVAWMLVGGMQALVLFGVMGGVTMSN